MVEFICDVCNEMMWNDIFLQGIFRDRGDPLLADFNQVSLTLDDTWRDLDLSAIVPADAKAVLFTLLIVNAAIGQSFQLRRKGNANFQNRSIAFTQVAGQPLTDDLVCPVDSNRFCQYNGNAGTWLLLTLTVKGWFF